MTQDSLTITEVEDDATVVAQEPEVVEAADTPLLRQVISHQDGMNFRRVVRSLFPLDVGLLAICLTCQKEQRADVIQYARNEQTGEILLVCQCTVRILQGVTK